MSSADKITVELVPAATNEVRILIGELDQELSAEYAPEQRHGLALDAIFAPGIRFFLARLNGAAAGCGGVAFFTDFAEVKRMYVREAARGRGVAQALLARFEEEARDAGFMPLRLETGGASDRGPPVLSAGRLPNLRGIWRLRHDAAARRRHECFMQKQLGAPAT